MITCPLVAGRMAEAFEVGLLGICLVIYGPLLYVGNGSGSKIFYGKRHFHFLNENEQRWSVNMAVEF